MPPASKMAGAALREVCACSTWQESGAGCQRVAGLRALLQWRTAPILTASSVTWGTSSACQGRTSAASEHTQLCCCMHACTGLRGFTRRKLVRVNQQAFYPTQCFLEPFDSLKLSRKLAGREVLFVGAHPSCCCRLLCSTSSFVTLLAACGRRLGHGAAVAVPGQADVPERAALCSVSQAGPCTPVGALLLCARRPVPAGGGFSCCWLAESPQRSLGRHICRRFSS